LKLRAAVTPVALVVAATGALAYAYLVDRGRISDADREARRRDVFPSFRVEEVSRVELARGGETMVLERERLDAGVSTWAMRSPRAAAADATAVDSLLRELEIAPRVRDVGEDAREKAPLGLDAPRVKGAITVGAIAYRFALGADASRPEGAAYMRIEGEGTFVVGRALKAQLLKDADTYRDHVLVPYGASDVARLEVQRPGGPGFVVVRRDAAFRVGDAEGLRASRAIIDKVFGALADARVDRFVSDGEADRAVAAPALSVHLTTGGASPAALTLVLGGPCPGDARDVVAVRTAPTRLGGCVAKHVAEALALGAEALVDRAAFFAHADEMEEVRLENLVDAKAPRVDVARRGTGWHERAPEDRDLVSDEVDAANALTLALASVDGTLARKVGAGQPFVARWRATVVRAGTSSSEVVEVSSPDGKGTAFRRAEDGAVLQAERAATRVLEPHPVALRSLAAARVPVDPGAVVALDDTCTAVPERLDLVAGLWKARPPSAFEVDPVAVSDLLSSLARARADAWIAEDDDGSFGFAAPGTCTVTLQVGPDADSGAPRRFGITFTPPGSTDARDVAARDLGDPAVFLAPRVLRETASHPAVDRGRFRLDLDALARVTLVRGSEKLVLLRASDATDPLVRAGARPADASDEPLDAALAALYAQSAAHTGPAGEGEGLDRPTLEIVATPLAAGHPETRLVFGAPVHETSLDGYFARASGVDATFLVPRHLLDAVLAAW
jgi:hypothetical protein